MSEKKQVSFYCDISLTKRFQELYPHCLTLFLQRVMHAVIFDKDLFSKIFFSEVNKDGN